MCGRLDRVRRVCLLFRSCRRSSGWVRPTSLETAETEKGARGWSRVELGPRPLEADWRQGRCRRRHSSRKRRMARPLARALTEKDKVATKRRAEL